MVGFNGHDHEDATDAQLRSPMGLAVHANGDLYVADTDNNLIRAVHF